MGHIVVILSTPWIMYKRFFLFLSFVLVFALGFVAGTRWRSPSLPPAPTLSIPDDETRIAKALEDPDFKRIHDRLTRERPMQLKIPELHESTAQDPTPMSERPPIQFTLDER